MIKYETCKGNVQLRLCSAIDELEGELLTLINLVWSSLPPSDRPMFQKSVTLACALPASPVWRDTERQHVERDIQYRHEQGRDISFADMQRLLDMGMPGELIEYLRQKMREHAGFGRGGE